MSLRPMLPLAIAAGLAGCATTPTPGPARGDAATCIRLFQWYDQAETLMSTPGGAADRMTIPPALQLPAQRLRQAGCITLSADLAGMATASGPRAAPPGAAIPPTRLHVGVVTNMADDAAAQAFFTANGIPVRSIGSAALGRRIYVGPFTNQGSLDAARDLAVRAGFRFPYPARI